MPPPFVHHPGYSADLPAGHRFPMDKYRALAARLEAEGLDGGGFLQPEPADEALVGMAHDPGYVRSVFDAQVEPKIARRIGLPMTASVAMRARLATAGTLLAARLALQHGLACNTAGGSHHAFRDGGAGFCTFNDVAVAAAQLLAEGAVRQILVVDLDVHQGDGTARIFEGEHRVFTLSLHAEKNFPVRKAASDLDVPLGDGLEDDAYLATAEAAVCSTLAAVRPQLVFYNAGVDPHRDDRLGRLALSDDGLARRERLVLDLCLAAGAPVCGVIGGGYGDDVAALADRHAHLFRQATEAARRWL